MKFEEVKSSEIKNGLLLDEEQTDYLFNCIKEAMVALRAVQASLRTTDSRADSIIYLKKLTEELNYCVTVLRKQNDL
jgi:hypothetical protein